MVIRLNDILSPVGAGSGFDALHRVIYIDVSQDSVVLMSLCRPWRMPVLRSLSEVNACLAPERRALSIGTFELPSYMFRGEEEIPASARTLRDNAWNAIEPLVSGPEAYRLYDPNLRGQVIAARAVEVQMQIKTLHRILFRYWVYGMTESAVLPDWANRGGRGKNRKGKAPGAVTGRKIGRPVKPAIESAGGVLVDFNSQASDLAVFQKAIALYYDEEGGSLRAVYRRMAQELYISGHRNIDGITVPIPLPANDVPSYNMFEYAVRRDFDEHELFVRRIGEREYLQNKRGLDGSGREGVLGPGDRYQIDATLADIYLVNRYRRDWLIGRPVVYLVIDLFSTMITGLFVGLWGPSWDCSRLALLNAFTNKRAFCNRHGIDIQDSDWPCDIVPTRLLADRQELLADAASSLRRDLQVHCEITPPYRPDLKFIETRFRLLNLDSRIQWLPGAVTQRARERGNRDYRLDAVLDLDQFTRILIKAILHYNKYHFCPQHLLSHPSTARAGIDATPLSMWNWGIQNGLGSLRREDGNLLRFGLLPKARASITARGVVFKGMRYETERALRERWFSRARNGGREAVEVAYDNSWTNSIWLRDTKTGQYEAATLRSTDELYRNRRIEETLDLLEINSVKPGRLVDQCRQSSAMLGASLAEEVAEAKNFAATHARSTSKAAQLAGIREQRAFQAQTDRLRDAFESYAGNPCAAKPALEPQAEDDEGESIVIDMLRQARDATRRSE